MGEVEWEKCSRIKEIGEGIVRIRGEREKKRVEDQRDC